MMKPCRHTLEDLRRRWQADLESLVTDARRDEVGSPLEPAVDSLEAAITLIGQRIDQLRDEESREAMRERIADQTWQRGRSA